MLISRKRFEIKKKEHQSKSDNIRETSQRMRKMLHGLSGRPICLRPYSEPGGNVAENDVRAVFFTGVNMLDIEAWVTALEKNLTATTVKSLKGKIIHYTLILKAGEHFTDDTARFSLETLATEMGYGTGDDYLTMSFWHAGANDAPEHLHMVACRLNTRDQSVLQEHEGWYHVGLQKIRAKIESVCGFAPARNATLVYLDGDFLRGSSVEFETTTGQPSEERLLKRTAETIAGDIRRGAIETWDVFFARCAEAGITYVLGPRGGGRMRSPNGFELHPSFWIPALSRGNLEKCFNSPFPAPLTTRSEI